MEISLFLTIPAIYWYILVVYTSINLFSVTFRNYLSFPFIFKIFTYTVSRIFSCQSYFLMYRKFYAIIKTQLFSSTENVDTFPDSKHFISFPLSIRE